MDKGTPIKNTSIELNTLEGRENAISTLDEIYDTSQKRPDSWLHVNHLPNDRTKHIDYVIYYFDKDNISEAELQQKQTYRDEFFKKLEKEGFVIYYLRSNFDNKKNVYALLHCSLERLMKEAERLELEMRLKYVGLIIKIICKKFLFFILSMIFQVKQHILFIVIVINI